MTMRELKINLAAELAAHYGITEYKTPKELFRQLGALGIFWFPSNKAWMPVADRQPKKRTNPAETPERRKARVQTWRKRLQDATGFISAEALATAVVNLPEEFRQKVLADIRRGKE